MAVTYDPIATTTLASTAASFTFSSIPTSWTDLRLVIVGSPTSDNQDVYIRVNGLTGIYTRNYLTARAFVAANSQGTQTNFVATQQTYTQTIVKASYIFDFFSYASTTLNKVILASNSADQNGDGGIDRIIGLAATNDAINSITALLSAGSWTIGSTATLYGIKAA
jgi:hypothetical protein